MSSDRYEIKGKIGQGGVGAVYRAYDMQLNRDVAIKRVLPDGGFQTSDEATVHLLKEATSLSSIQHPHIVTVYDSGVDEDGPYVVMELLDGRTLDEMVERSVLTVEDFKEMALQSQEALIAAQDLNLVHRDLKPSNVMVTWLPSGRFQVKIVDFGLAKFSPKPSLQTIDHGDSVFGSIFFMAPEQFERTELDQRTDMYAMGCVYYYCLTGCYPFDGETAAEVMEAHLEHRVVPVKEHRPDVPNWINDWIMWHMNRDMDHRPENARAALESFLLNDQARSAAPNQPGAPISAPAPSRPKLNMDGGPSKDTGTAPQPIAPPRGNMPSVHTSAQAAVSKLTGSQPLAPSVRKTTGPVDETPRPTAPVALKPAAGTTPVPGISPGTGTQPVAPNPATGPNSLTGPNPLTGRTGTLTGLQPTKKGLGSGAKVVIAAVIGMLIIAAAIATLNQIKTNKSSGRLKDLVTLASGGRSEPIPVTREDVELMLGSVKSLQDNARRDALYQALFLAEATDGTNVDQMIAETAYAESTPVEIRKKLLNTVLRLRGKPEQMKGVINFINNAKTGDLAAAGARATESMAQDSDLPALLEVVKSTPYPAVRQAVEKSINKLVERSERKKVLSADLVNAYRTAQSEEYKNATLRMLGPIGGGAIERLIREALESRDDKEVLSGIAAVRNFPNDDVFPLLMNRLSIEDDQFIKDKAFEAALAFMRDNRERDESDTISMWRQIFNEAQSESEKLKAIKAIAPVKAPWVFEFLMPLMESQHGETVNERARKARRYVENRLAE